MSLRYLVKVSYSAKFEFENLKYAVAFATSAIEHCITDIKEIEITVVVDDRNAEHKEAESGEEEN